MHRLSLNCKTVAGLMIFGATLLDVSPVLAQKSNFTIGTATGTQLSTCPSDPTGVSGNCWGLNVSCPNVPPLQPYDATVKVTNPSGASIGTVIFLTGGTGNDFYDKQFLYGSSLINQVVGVGYTAVQIEFDNPVAGWLTGPAADGNGPLSLACLPSTSMQWVHDNILRSGTPLCATGNSGGSQMIAYALSQYGLSSIFSMVEPTSGPELSRLDYGCAPQKKYTACAICGFGTLQESYGPTIAESGIDPAYTGVVQPGGPCYEGVKGSTQDASLLHHDSTLSDTYPPTLSFPATDIHFAFGGLDTSAAIPEGLDWASMITSKTAIVCVPSAGHMLASSQAGAVQIGHDLINYCKLQP
ncbi:MAG TPA: hypothetical protein VMT20_17530 [Terriglobia bacterium]|nr:hypothetical protein [Terriglobia bacterium]